MDEVAASRVIALFERRGQLDALGNLDESAALECLNRAAGRLEAARVLQTVEMWESAFTTAYDAYRGAGEAIVLRLGYRVPATAGAHQITIAIAHSAVGSETDAFAPATGERFRQGRHESEYFDPTRRVDKTLGDTAWAVQVAAQAITAVTAGLQSS